jgi:putative DNA-invertase from lambdoid prophage Rac
MATILYARVSTAEQTIEHQLAHAKAAGFTIDEVVADNGVSGLHSRLVERPEGRDPADRLPNQNDPAGAEAALVVWGL